MSPKEELQQIDNSIWGPCLRSDHFAAVITSDANHEYQILGVFGDLYILADDIARYTGRDPLEVLEHTGHGNEVYYPERRLPYPISDAVRGLYVPFDKGLHLIPSAGDCGYDVYELVAFRNEFDFRKSGS